MTFFYVKCKWWWDGTAPVTSFSTRARSAHVTRERQFIIRKYMGYCILQCWLWERWWKFVVYLILFPPNICIWFLLSLIRMNIFEKTFDIWIHVIWIIHFCCDIVVVGPHGLHVSNAGDVVFFWEVRVSVCVALVTVLYDSCPTNLPTQCRRNCKYFTTHTYITIVYIRISLSFNKNTRWQWLSHLNTFVPYVVTCMIQEIISCIIYIYISWYSNSWQVQ